MDVLFQEIEMTQSIVQPHVRDNVRLIPVLRMKPAFRYHALGDEINDVIGLEIADTLHGSLEVVVKIELLKPKITRGAIVPFIRKKNGVQFRRATEAKDIEPLAEQMIDEMTSGEGIAPQNNGSLWH
jgi:hypothetical protein